VSQSSASSDARDTGERIRARRATRPGAGAAEAADHDRRHRGSPTKAAAASAFVIDQASSLSETGSAAEIDLVVIESGLFNCPSSYGNTMV
jgi:hypothetical protein